MTEENTLLDGVIDVFTCYPDALELGVHFQDFLDISSEEKWRRYSKNEQQVLVRFMEDFLKYFQTAARMADSGLRLRALGMTGGESSATEGVSVKHESYVSTFDIQLIRAAYSLVKFTRDKIKLHHSNCHVELSYHPRHVQLNLNWVEP